MSVDVQNSMQDRLRTPSGIQSGGDVMNRNSGKLQTLSLFYGSPCAKGIILRLRDHIAFLASYDVFCNCIPETNINSFLFFHNILFL